MAVSANNPKRVIIVGGGISGLTVALTLVKEADQNQRALDCVVVEAQSQWGGKILTSHHAGRIIEGGPDSFLTIKPGGLALCTQLGLTGELINTNQGNSQTFAYSRGRLREFPQGLVSMVPTQLGPLFQSGLVSWMGILRMAGDWLIPPRAPSDPEETLAEFFSRRLGREAFHRLIEPLVAGIYAGDASELSVTATFPQFVELERQHGGLIKGALAQQRTRGTQRKVPASGRTLFASFKGGMGDLVTALVQQLEQRGARLLLGKKVIELRKGVGNVHTNAYTLDFENGESLEADAIVLATPAFVSGKLVRGIAPDLSSLLDQIPYASTITLSLVFPRAEVQGCFQGFGFVVPRIEDRMLIAATWSSMKWADRVSSEESLIRCYLGGRGREQVLEWDDDRLIHHCLDDLREMVGLACKPKHAEVFRWNQGMPQYRLGHLDRVKRVREQVKMYPGLYVSGAAYQGIGIPDCIRDGQQTAESVGSYLWNQASLSGGQVA